MPYVSACVLYGEQTKRLLNVNILLNCVKTFQANVLVLDFGKGYSLRK